MPTSISLDNFSSAGLHYKRSPILPNALTNFVTSAQQQPHDSHYSNVNTSPYSKLKFQQEEATIQESLEYEAGDDMSKPASSTAHSTTHMASNNTTRTNDDSVSFYSTPLNATKNDSASSKASSPSSTAETHGDKHSSLSSMANHRSWSRPARAKPHSSSTRPSKTPSPMWPSRSVMVKSWKRSLRRVTHSRMHHSRLSSV